MLTRQYLHAVLPRYVVLEVFSPAFVEIVSTVCHTVFGACDTLPDVIPFPSLLKVRVEIYQGLYKRSVSQYTGERAELSPLIDLQRDRNPQALDLCTILTDPFHQLLFDRLLLETSSLLSAYLLPRRVVSLHRPGRQGQTRPARVP